MLTGRGSPSSHSGEESPGGGGPGFAATKDGSARQRWDQNKTCCCPETFHPNGEPSSRATPAIASGAALLGTMPRPAPVPLPRGLRLQSLHIPTGREDSTGLPPRAGDIHKSCSEHESQKHPLLRKQRCPSAVYYACKCLFLLRVLRSPWRNYIMRHGVPQANWAACIQVFALPQFQPYRMSPHPCVVRGQTGAPIHPLTHLLLCIQSSCSRLHRAVPATHA